MSHLLTRIQEPQKKEINSLSDAREFQDPETGSSSGEDPRSRSALHCSESQDQPCDSGLPHDTRNIMGITGNVFERPPAREKTNLYPLQQFKRHSASSSQELRSDTTGNKKEAGE